MSDVQPIPMIIHCPGSVMRNGFLVMCGARHVDEGVFATKVHHTHTCQTCGHTWRHAVVPTVGVQFLPGFKDDLTGLLRPVDDLGLSVRTAHCLRNEKILLVGEAVQRSEHDYLKLRNFYRKSLTNLQQVLEPMGLRLGMRLSPEVVANIRERREQIEREGTGA